MMFQLWDTAHYNQGKPNLLERLEQRSANPGKLLQIG